MKNTNGRSLALRALFAGTSLWALAAVAHAQPAQGTAAAVPSGAPADAVGQVVVTASRVQNAGFAAPTPTTVVGSAAIEQRQVTNIAQLLYEIPALRATTTPESNGSASARLGANTVDLRGLGAQRTLVLIDGHRVVPTAPSNTQGAGGATTVDLNQVPTLMIDRVEVVTGGAGASWGSDAVAGVVNVILKNRFEGFEATAQAGIAEEGDGFNWRVGTLAGTSFAGGKGHIVGGFDYERRTRRGGTETRDWGRRDWGVVRPVPATTPANILAENVNPITAPGGLITASTATGANRTALVGQAFTAGGTGIRPFQFGAVRSTTNMIGGEEVDTEGVSLSPGSERFDPYLHMEYDLGKVTAILEGSYAIAIGTNKGNASGSTGLVIQRDNAFLPAAVTSRLAPGQTITISRVNADFPGVRQKVKNRTPQIVFGLKGDLGGSWNWDGHVSWGKNFYTSDSPNNRITQRFDFARDAVVGPSGQIVCRATLPGASFNPAAAGCVPIDIIGLGSPSAQSLDYFLGTSHVEASYLQQTAALNLHGEPFSTWAGPVSIAVGAEYRRESESSTGDPIALAGGYNNNNGAAFKGYFEVKEGYGEVLVPLAKDIPFFRSLDLNGALRVSDYSTAGTKTTWKVGGTWSPVEGVKFRAVRSLDIRAPQVFELFSPGALTRGTVTVPSAPGLEPVQAQNVPQITGIGNANLDVEQARTTTLGAVLQPMFVPGLSLSVDYFDINLTGLINPTSAPAAATNCILGDVAYCNLFSFDATGTPVFFTGRYINTGGEHQYGLDIAASYRVPVARLGLPGTMTATFSGTYYFHDYRQTSFVLSAVENAGTNTTTPRFRSNTSIIYSPDSRLTTSLQMITVSKGRRQSEQNQATPSLANNNNRLPPYAIFNAQVSYRLNDQVRVFGGIDNIFDTPPPIVTNAMTNTVTVGGLYNTLGRAFRIGIDLRH